MLVLAWIYVGCSQDYGGHPCRRGETFRTILENCAELALNQDLRTVATAQTQLLLFKGTRQGNPRSRALSQSELQRRNVPLDQLDPYSDPGG